MNIKNVLKNGIDKLNRNEIDESNLKAKILLGHILNVNKEYLIVNNNKELMDEQIIKFNKYIDLIIEGKPIQYITNKQEFMGLEFYVDENVLIPQPDTEILVETAINNLKKIMSNDNVGTGRALSEKINILDLCTGSGAIAISIAKYIEKEFENQDLYKINASDISKKALEIAKENAKKNKVDNKIKFIKSNMFEDINNKFDIMVSNPPYIETGVIQTLSKEVQNEPKIALDGGQDGLYFYRIIANEAYKYLKNNGILILEIGYNQKDAVVKLLEETRMYKNIECKKDYSNNNRCIICKGE